MTDLSTSVLGFAHSQIGVCEHPRGSNWGPDVQRYLAFVNVTKPEPWCAAFVCYCVAVGAANISVVPEFRYSASALRLVTLNPSLVIAAPEPGCVGVIDEGKGLGHTFFIELVNGASVHTVEGNTDSAGSREGWEVAERDRPVASISYFLRLA